MPAAVDAGAVDVRPTEAEPAPDAGPDGYVHPAAPDEGICRAGTAGAEYRWQSKCSDLSLVGRSLGRVLDTKMPAPVGHGGSIVDGDYTMTSVSRYSQPSERCLSTAASAMRFSGKTWAEVFFGEEGISVLSGTFTVDGNTITLHPTCVDSSEPSASVDVTGSFDASATGFALYRDTTIVGMPSMASGAVFSRDSRRP